VLGGGNRSTKVILNPQELKKLAGAKVIEGLGILK
jgi:prolyl-tRNA editing enzyme YbaK/EbsC (Cys-tRNA(Pro) deacylase)